MGIGLLDNLTVTSGDDAQELVVNTLADAPNASLRLPLLLTSPSKKLPVLVPLLVVLQDTFIELPVLVIEVLTSEDPSL